MEKHNKLLSIALILSLLLLAITGGILLYSVTHQDDIREQFKNEIATEVSKIKAPKGERGDSGLTVTGPRGLQGYPGSKGDTGATGVMGLQGNKGDPGAQGSNGSQGPIGPQGEQGAQGEPGANGRAVEFRCNPANDNYEYRYVGDDGWIIIERNSNACKSSPL